MKRALVCALFAAVLSLAVAVPTYANQPTAIPFADTFDDVNPCTGQVHTVTIEGTVYVHEHDGRVVARADRTITTTPTSFVGHGTGTFLDNGRVLVSRFTDVVANDAGDRIGAHGVFVLDLATGKVRVDAFDLTCLGG
jgi:hypothetical protein